MFKHSAISSYKPMMCLTHPNPRKTTTGYPVGLPRSDRLTVKGRSSDACGNRVKGRSVVRRAERRYCAIACEGELVEGFVNVERSNPGIGGWSDVVELEKIEDSRRPSERLEETFRVSICDTGMRGKERERCSGRGAGDGAGIFSSVRWTSSAMVSTDDLDTRSTSSDFETLALGSGCSCRVSWLKLCA